MRKVRAKAVFGKIGLKLVIPYLIISFLTLILIAGLIYYNFNVQNDSIQKIQEEISIKASSEINNYIESIIKELNLISKDVSCLECMEHNRKILKILIEEDPSIHEIAIINKEGVEINKIIKYDPKASLELKDLSTQNKFKKAIEGNRYLGPVYISKYDIPFISISLPIVDENGEKIGVLSAEVDLSPMWGTISKIRVKKTGYVYVVDENGNLIAYKDISLVKKNLDLKYIPGVENFLDNVHTPEHYTSFNDEVVIGTWESVATTDWGVVVELPMREVYQELSVPIFMGVALLILCVLFVVIILIVILRKLLKPISYLQKGVMAVRGGNLEYKISKVSNDELGDLAEAFNQMTTDIKESRKKLEEYSKSLEKQVAERTKELEKSKKELEVKVDELERFSKLSVGRELKMVELKKRIRELEKQKERG